MRYMVAYSLKDNLSPSDWSKISKKFQTWQPPDGLTVEGNWLTGVTGFMLANTDSYDLVVEVLAQFSEALSYVVHPVIPAEQAPAPILRGLDWAMK